MYSQEQHKNPNNQTSELLTDTENEYNETKASFTMYTTCWGDWNSRYRDRIITVN